MDFDSKDSDRSSGVVTVGSICFDLMAFVDQNPHIGETIIGREFRMSTGDKGGNQALKVAMCNTPSYMVTRVGNDIFSPLVFERFKSAGVNCDFIMPDDSGTDIGHVTVSEQGDYYGIMIPRASAHMTEADIDKSQLAFDNSKVLLLQLEIPITVSEYAARRAREKGLKVVLNAAPALDIPNSFWDCIDILVVNEIEATMLAHQKKIPSEKVKDYFELIKILEKKCENVIITLGDLGIVACFAGNPEIIYLEAHKVDVYSTVGAGDTFIGAFASEVVKGRSFKDSLAYANAIAALAISTPPTLTNTRIDYKKVEEMIK